jgi:hypothetical protein
MRSRPAAVLARSGWRVFARSPIGAPVGASTTWDGRMLLEVGGGNPGGEPRVRRAAAAFDPITGRWRTIASVPLAVLPDAAAAVWTGSKLFIFGASESPGPRPSGIAGLYDPRSNTWALTPPAPIDTPSDSVAAVSNGKRVILVAVSGSYGHEALQTAAYEPAYDRWNSIPVSVPPGHDPLAVEMVATNRGVLMWSLWSRSLPIGPNSFTIYSGVDVFRLSSGAWRLITGAWPQHRTIDQPLSTGSRVLLGANQIWCGVCSHPVPHDTNGWSVNPATLKVTKLPHGPLDDLQPQIMWSGRAEIALNPGGEIIGPHVRVMPGDIAFLDLMSGRWYEGPRAPRPLGQLPAVWDGSHLLVLAQNGQILSYGP